MKSRPLGVMICAIVFIVVGGLGTLFFVQSTFWPPVDERSRIMTAMFRPLSLLLGLASLTLGSGLVMMKAWARRLTIVAATFWILFMLMVVWRGSSDFVSWRNPAPYFVAWNGFIAWYFLRPSVKAQFCKAG